MQVIPPCTSERVICALIVVSYHGGAIKSNKVALTNRTAFLARQRERQSSTSVGIMHKKWLFCNLIRLPRPPKMQWEQGKRNCCLLLFLSLATNQVQPRSFTITHRILHECAKLNCSRVHTVHACAKRHKKMASGAI